jgi:CHAD domain-containing protein
MKTHTDSKPLVTLDFAALLPGLAGVLADSAAHYRDTNDAEDIHAIRVATRRARAALKLPANAVRPGAVTLAVEAKWLAGSVSATRDADVLIATVNRVAERRKGKYGDDLKPLQLALTNTANLAMGSAKRSLGSKRFAEFVGGLRSFHRTVADGTGAEISVAGAARPLPPLKQLARDHRGLRRAAKRAFTTGRQEDFHRMRIAVKKARYSLEAVSAGHGGAAATQLARLRDLQDLMGEAHDLQVASERVTVLTERNLEKWERPALKAAGRLNVDLLKRASRLEKRVPALARNVTGKRWAKAVRKLQKTTR